MSDSSNNVTREASCLDDYDPNALPVTAALKEILNTVKPVSECETVSIKTALGRTLAADIKAPLDVPGHTNSAMDGYAIRAADLNPDTPTVFRQVGTALAGHPFDGKTASGECVRIMTGAPLPEDCDTVVIQEHAEVNGDDITLGADNRAGQNVRLAGEDIAVGQTVLTAGKALLPADIGLLASLGVTEINVTRPIKVAFFSTGDELIPSGEPLGAGQIYDSNRYVLNALLLRMGIQALDLGIVKDTETAISQAFHTAAEQADVVITSGGVSVGEADFIKDVLDTLGHVHFWKVAIKPGRPLAFGNLSNAFYFGLPGNPVSVMVTFYILVRPALQKLMGQKPQPPLRLKARCIGDLRKRPGRVEYQRGVFKCDAGGEYTVTKTGAQGSGILSSMSTANCLIVLPEDTGTVAADSMVEIIPFDGMV